MDISNMEDIKEGISSFVNVVRNHPGICVLVIGIWTCLVYYLQARCNRTLTRGPEAELVGKVSRLFLYPVKSMQPMADVESLLCDRMGVRSNNGHYIRDRSWMVALESGTSMTMQAEPRLALIQPSFSPSGDLLKLDAPYMPTLTVSTRITQHTNPTLDVNVGGLHSEAVHCGKEAADWICTYLGKKGFILVYHPPTVEGRQVNEGPEVYHKAFTNKDKVAFADPAPVHLMTEETIHDVSSRVDGMMVSENNFRPNIYIAGSSAYDEDNWDKVYIGDKVVLENRILAQRSARIPHIDFDMRNGSRCLETTVDQEMGVKNEEQEPLATIKKYRPKIKDSPCLGLFMSVLQDGEIRVGDKVFATRKK